MVTDLTVTGRVAQFGRGVLADVSAKLLGQFVDCLENKLLATWPTSATCRRRREREGQPKRRRTGSPAGTAAHGPLDLASEGAAAGPRRTISRPTRSRRRRPPRPPSSGGRLDGTSGPAVKVVDSPEPEPVDLLEAAGAPVAKRAAPALVGLTILWLLSVFIRRRRRRRRSS